MSLEAPLEQQDREGRDVPGEILTFEPEGANPLIMLPAKARQALYVAYLLVGLAVNSTLVAFATLGRVPVWLTVAVAVVSYLSTPFAAIAASNVQKRDTPPS